MSGVNKILKIKLAGKTNLGGGDEKAMPDCHDFHIGISGYRRAELTVVNTNPKNGAAGIPPALKEIRIEFSAPVKMNSWSFVKTDKGAFPQLRGEPSFANNKVCILPVELKPGITYSVGVNSPTRKGFKSARDEKIACVPYVLTFTTAVFPSSGKTEAGAGASFEQGRSLYEAGKYEEALDVFNRILESEPRNADAYMYRSSCWAVLGDLNRALADCNSAIDINPGSAELYVNRGLNHARMGNNELAVQDYNRALKIEPQMAGAWCYRGVARARMGDIQGAIADAEKALSINPGHEKAAVLLEKLKKK